MQPLWDSLLQACRRATKSTDGSSHLMEDAHNYHINLADIVHIIDALVQAADHIHSGLHRRPGRHGSVCCVRAVRRNHRVACMETCASPTQS